VTRKTELNRTVMSKLKIFSGTANRPLAEGIAKAAGMEIGSHTATSLLTFLTAEASSVRSSAFFGTFRGPAPEPPCCLPTSMD